MSLTLLALAAVALLALLPLLGVLRAAAPGRDRRGAAMALHRAQLIELGREREAGRIGPEDHAAAVLEVQRRLLADDQAPEPAALPGGRGLLIAACVALPVAAVMLYARAGRPDLPAEPLAARLAAIASDPAHATTDELIAGIRQRLRGLPRDSEQARAGWLLLGNTLDAQGRLAEAAAAWRQAVAIRFDPALAALSAEAQSRVSGHVDADSRALFVRALTEGARDAPWRAVAEARLREP